MLQSPWQQSDGSWKRHSYNVMNQALHLYAALSLPPQDHWELSFERDRAFKVSYAVDLYMPLLKRASFSLYLSISHSRFLDLRTEENCQLRHTLQTARIKIKW